MKGREARKVFSRMMPVVLVLSFFSPFSSTAAGQENEENENQETITTAIEEQLKLVAKGPRLHEDLQNVSSDEEVAVIIHLTEMPVAIKEGIQASKGQTLSQQQETDIIAEVEAQQAQVKAELQKKNILYEETHSYSTVLNGFSATVKAEDLKKMLEVPSIRAIEPDQTIRMTKDAVQQTAATEAVGTSVSAPEFLGVNKLWAEGLQGEGVKVAVLGTGIDPDHPEFKDVYKGGKNFVKHSFRYTKPRADNDPSETKPSERANGQPEFDASGTPFATSQGTLAAGIIAAAGNNSFEFKGMAPEVDLYAYRVIGAYGIGRVSWVLAGIEEAAEQDMDVLNFSFDFVGSSEHDSLAYAINNATLAGTTSVLAAGTEWAYRSSVETPATSRLGIAVGNTTLPEEKHSGTINARIGERTLKITATLMATTFNERPAEQLRGEYELAAIPQTGRAEDYKGIDATGKVVVVAMGGIAPEEKIRVAKARGAIAVFFHNVEQEDNAPEPSGIFLGSSFDFIPAFDLSQTDGEALRLHLKDEKGTTAFGAFKTTLTEGDEVDDTSAQGPTDPNYDIKPDVLAPGMHILSTKPVYDSESYAKAYAHGSGAYMSAAHVTGIVALLKQAHPEWTPFDIKVALSNTAKRLDPKKYDVFTQGAGRVQADAAAHPEVLAYAEDKAMQNETGVLVDNPKGTVTFGEHSLKEKNLALSRKILVKDIAGAGGQFKATVEVTKTFGDAKVIVDKPVFNLKGQQELTVNLTASKTEEAGDEAEVLGYIHLSKGKTTISLPFAAGLGKSDSVDVEQMNVSILDLSPNGDGIKDKGELSFTLSKDVFDYNVGIFDLSFGGEEDREFFDDIGFLFEGQSMKKGKHTLTIDGTYKPDNGEVRTTIPDGVYGIQLAGKEAAADEYGYQLEVLFPFFVKASKPVITGSISQSTATGKVTDKYLDFNKALIVHHLDYDLNEKLHAAYIITRNGQTEGPVPFNLEQDGSFSVPVPMEDAIDTVTIEITDAAGNKGQAVIYRK